MKALVVFSLLLTSLTTQAALVCQSTGSSYSLELQQYAEDFASGTLSMAGYELANMTCFENAAGLGCIPSRLTDSAPYKAKISSGKVVTATILKNGKAVAKLSCAQR